MSVHHSPHPAADAGSPTVVGVDLGVRHLVVAAPGDSSTEVEDALLADGNLARALFDELGAVTTRLRLSPTDTLTAEACAYVWYRERIMEQFASAVASVLDYLDEQDADVLAMEDISYPRKPLMEFRHGDGDVGAWTLPAFQHRLETAARANGYRVEVVEPEYTTKECHQCGVHGEKVSGGRLRCINDACPVEAVCRDRSAAVSIAKRAPAYVRKAANAPSHGRPGDFSGGVADD